MKYFEILTYHCAWSNKEFEEFLTSLAFSKTSYFIRLFGILNFHQEIRSIMSHSKPNSSPWMGIQKIRQLNKCKEEDDLPAKGLLQARFLFQRHQRKTSLYNKRSKKDNKNNNLTTTIFFIKSCDTFSFYKRYIFEKKLDLKTGRRNAKLLQFLAV